MARWVTVGLAVRVVGCTYATPAVHVPPGLPGLAAGQIALGDVDVARKGGDMGRQTAADVCGEVEDILGRAVRGRAASGSDARVDVQVRLEGSDDFISDAGYEDGCGAMPLLVAAPAGAMTENERVSVDLTLRTGGATFRGHGYGDRNGSMYVGARRRALAVALDHALADAATRGPG
jgi:hypothetical protein